MKQSSFILFESLNLFYIFYKSTNRLIQGPIKDYSVACDVFKCLSNSDEYEMVNGFSLIIDV